MEMGSGQIQRPGLKSEGCKGGMGCQVRTGREHPTPQRRARAGAAHRREMGQARNTSLAGISWKCRDIP